MGPVWGPAAVGAIVGAAYAALNRLGMKRIWRAPYSPLNVVVTGGTRGLGKAMAREFLKCVLDTSLFRQPALLTMHASCGSCTRCSHGAGYSAMLGGCLCA